MDEETRRRGEKLKLCQIVEDKNGGFIYLFH